MVDAYVQQVDQRRSDVDRLERKAHERESNMGDTGAALTQRDDHINGLVRQLNQLRTKQADFDYSLKMNDEYVKKLSDSVNEYADNYVNVEAQLAQTRTELKAEYDSFGEERRSTHAYRGRMVELERQVAHLTSRANERDPPEVAKHNATFLGQGWTLDQIDSLDWSKHVADIKTAATSTAPPAAAASAASILLSSIANRVAASKAKASPVAPTAAPVYSRVADLGIPAPTASVAPGFGIAPMSGSLPAVVPHTVTPLSGLMRSTAGPTEGVGGLSLPPKGYSFGNPDERGATSARGRYPRCYVLSC